MRIAICDDEKDELTMLKGFIAQFNPDLHVSSFTSALALLEVLNQELFDLIFLDIEMEPLNGFTAAKLISGSRQRPLIVFVTKSSKYTIQGYEVAFRYLVKPVSYEDFEKVISAAVEQITPRKIIVDINGESQIIATNDIRYCEVSNHTLKIHTQLGSLIIRESLHNMEIMLGGTSFVRPHNSFLINMAYIAGVNKNEILLKNGVKISISRKKKDEFFDILHRYLRR